MYMPFAHNGEQVTRPEATHLIILLNCVVRDEAILVFVQAVIYAKITDEMLWKTCHLRPSSLRRSGRPGM